MREKHEQELRELERAREESDRRHEALAPALEERTQELRDLERAREERATELEELARIRAEHEQEVEALAQAREEHERDVEALGRELKALVRVREEQEQELSELMRARAEHAQELEELARARAQQAQELEEITRARSEQAQELEALTKSRAEQERELAALKKLRAEELRELEALPKTPPAQPAAEIEPPPEPVAESPSAPEPAAEAHSDAVPAEPKHGEIALVGAPSAPAKERSPGEILRELAERMTAGDDFQVLGVAASSSDKEVYSAYLALLREVPEIDEGPATLVQAQKAKRVRSRLEAAYGNLQTQEKRRAYALLREEEESDRKAKPSAERALEGERWFRKGKAHLDGKRSDEAIEAFGMAAHLDPEQGEYASHLGYALYLSNPSDSVVRREAMEHLASGIKRSPRDALAHVFLGRIVKAKGDLDAPKRIFEKALRIQRDFHPAVQELRVLEMRERNSKGVLSRLIGR